MSRTCHAIEAVRREVRHLQVHQRATLLVLHVICTVNEHTRALLDSCR